MNRALIVLMAWMLTACGTPALAMETAKMQITSTPQPSATWTPSIDWKATADNAQLTAKAADMTAVEAIRMGVAATEAHEQRAQENIRLTAQWDSATATAALTSIPATFQAHSDNMTAAAWRLEEVKINATSTSGAPALLRDMKSAEAYNAHLDFFVTTWMKFMIGLFCLVIPILIWNLRVPLSRDEVVEDEQPEPVEMTLTLKQDNGGGYTQTQRIIIPCSDEMMTELADGVMSGSKSLAINQWEGASSKHWTRPTFDKMRRSFLLPYKLAQSDPNGGLVLTEAGRDLFAHWLKERALPSPTYEFTHDHGEIIRVSAHAHEAHTHEDTKLENTPPPFSSMVG